MDKKMTADELTQKAFGMSAIGVENSDTGRWNLKYFLNGKEVVCEVTATNSFAEILRYPLEMQEKFVQTIIELLDKPGESLSVMKDLSSGKVKARAIRLVDTPNKIHLLIVH